MAGISLFGRRPAPTSAPAASNDPIAAAVIAERERIALWLEQLIRDSGGDRAYAAGLAARIRAAER